MDYLLLFMAVGFTVGTVRQLLQSWRTMSSVPASIEWAASRKEIFPNVRACVREVFAGLNSLTTGYDQVDPSTSIITGDL